MVREKFAVRLTPEERDQLEHMVRAGRSSTRVTTRARILLKTDEGWSAPRVAEALDVSQGTVFRMKRRFAEEGLEAALKDRVQAHRYRKLDERGEAHLIALACSPAPEGHAFAGWKIVKAIRSGAKNLVDLHFVVCHGCPQSLGGRILISFSSEWPRALKLHTPV